MKQRLRPIDDDDVIYDLPTDEDLIEMGVDPKCSHGYVSWSCCPTCPGLVAGIIWDVLLMERGQ